MLPGYSLMLGLLGLVGFFALAAGVAALPAAADGRHRPVRLSRVTSSRTRSGFFSVSAPAWRETTQTSAAAHLAGVRP